jgi:hypothetical protein
LFSAPELPGSLSLLKFADDPLLDELLSCDTPAKPLLLFASALLEGEAYSRNYICIIN